MELRKLLALCLIFTVIGASTVLPVYAQSLIARAVTGASPNVPTVTFAGDRRGQVQPASFSVVATDVLLPVGFNAGPVVFSTAEDGPSNPVTMMVGSALTPDLSGIATAWTTVVTGTIVSPTVWAEHTLLTGTVTIATGVPLTITPGVTVFGAPGSQLIVDGALFAEGTAAEPIYFTSSETDAVPSSWLGIRITKRSHGFSLSHALVQYAKNAVYFQSNAEGTALLTGTVRNCTLQHNERGLYTYIRPDASPYTFVATAVVTLTHNTIFSNTAAGVTLATAVGGGWSNNFSLVEGNLIEENTVGIEVLANSWWLGHANNRAIVRNNTIRNNGEIGIDVRAAGSSDGSGSDTRLFPIIENNLLEGNDVGIRLYLNPYGRGRPS